MHMERPNSGKWCERRRTKHRPYLWWVRRTNANMFEWKWGYPVACVAQANNTFAPQDYGAKCDNVTDDSVPLKQWVAAITNAALRMGVLKNLRRLRHQ